MLMIFQSGKIQSKKKSFSALTNTDRINENILSSDGVRRRTSTNYFNIIVIIIRMCPGFTVVYKHRAYQQYGLPLT